MATHGISFGDWCVANGYAEILNLWDYDKNSLSPYEVKYKSRKKFYFKCKCGIHESELKCIGDFTNGSFGVISCITCNSFAQWGINNICEDFLDKYWDYDLNELNPWIVSRGSRKTVFIKCQEKDYHGSYDITPNNFGNGSRCSYCYNHRGAVHKNDSIASTHPEVLNLWSDKNEKTPFEYSSGSVAKVWIKCKHGIHEDSLCILKNLVNRNFDCKYCSEENGSSKLQLKVKEYLKSLGFSVLHEYDCSLKVINPKTLNTLPFDNEVVDLNLIIEVHGEQHYKITNFVKMEATRLKISNEEALRYIKIKDRYKRISAKHKGFNYLEIPYTLDNKKDSWKKLLDVKILEIQERGC